jgi:hypothetical protein
MKISIRYVLQHSVVVPTFRYIQPKTMQLLRLRCKDGW